MRDKAFTARPARQHGLTLIELLVAITILAFIAVLGWRGLDSIVRTRLTLTDDIEQTRGTQLAFAQLQSDCAHLADPYVLPDRVPILVEQDRLKMIRTVFAENQPSRMQVVTYQLRDGVLTRRESAETRDLRELDRLWQSASDADVPTQAVALRSGIAAFDMRLWLGGGWRSGAEALSSAPAAAAGQPAQLRLPTGLEVKLQLSGHRGSLSKIFLLGVV